jgi:hypothetical protein
MSATASTIAATLKCRICRSKLDADEADDLVNQVCSSCLERPEGRRILAFPKPAAIASTKKGGARDFTPADRALIKKVHGFMPTAQLLMVLNERLAADLGPDAAPYTIDQLHQEIEQNGAPTPNGGHDWPSLRKLLVVARRNGVLSRIDEQRIDDFAVVFSLSPAQVLRLKDVLVGQEEEA